MRRVPTTSGRWGLCALVVAIVVGLAMGDHVGAQQPAQPTRGEFMRKKLDFSQGVLEGLTVENYDLIAKNARALKVLSQAAEWEVPMIPHVELYLPYTTEFQSLCDELVANARSKNIDGATLAYVRLTLNCVNCHKYVRTVTE